MADIYDRSRKTAIRMLGLRSKGGKGEKLKLTISSTDEPEVIDGIVVPNDDIYLGSGVRIEYTNRDINDTVIKMGDVKFLVSPIQLDGTDMPTEIQPQSKIEFAGSVYSVVNSKPWNFTGLSIGFEVQARK